MGINNGITSIGHDCSRKVDVRLRDLIITRTISIQRDIPTSYEIVWAIARTVPSKAYFEFLAQPAARVAYTFNLAMAENKGAENSELKIHLGLGIRFPSDRARKRASIGAM